MNQIVEKSVIHHSSRLSFHERIAMHSRIVRFGILVLALCLCSFCQKSNSAKDSLVKINGTTVTKSDFEAFQEAKGMYPAARSEYFSRNLNDMTFFITVQLLYEKAKSTSLAAKEKSSDDWKWKQLFYPAQLYFRNSMQPNLGFSEKELNAYFTAHREKYKKTVPADTAVKDTLNKAARGKIVKRDSVVYLTLQDVKEQVVDSMFLHKYPVPDSLYKKNAQDTSKVDSAGIRDRYLFSVRRGALDFFTNRLFQEKLNKKHIDSLNEWYGEGKFITPKDMKVITSWVSEDQRSYYDNPRGTLELAKWLLRWKLLTEKAEKAGFVSQDDFKAILQWAYKLHLVYSYVDKELMPAVKKMASVDTAMCVFAWADNSPNPAGKPDSLSLSRVVDMYIQQKACMTIDSQVFEMRKKAGIVLLKKDYTDDGGGNPAALIMHADSLRDTGNTNEAENTYDRLTKSFPFTPEGQRAFTELAKILTEKQQYQQAIKNYRDYLLLSNDKSKRCNTFFMIGFIYDEYLNRSEDARINYRWVLKNTPECELTDDAEFMSLHLGEAMNSVEELRAEAMRQGKKVDTSAIEPSVDTMKNQQTKVSSQ